MSISQISFTGSDFRPDFCSGHEVVRLIDEEDEADASKLATFRMNKHTITQLIYVLYDTNNQSIKIYDTVTDTYPELQAAHHHPCF